MVRIAGSDTVESCDTVASPRGAHGWAFAWRDRSHAVMAMLLLPAFAGIYCLSYWLRFEGQLDSYAIHSLLATITWVVLTKFAWFVAMKVCWAWNRIVTFYDLVVLVQASTAGTLTIAILNYALRPSPAIPRSIFLLDWGATLLILGGARAIVRGFRENARSLLSTTDQVRVFVVGAGDAGELVLRAVRRMATPNCRVVGFIDDDPSLAGTRVEGVPVVGTLAQACPLAQLHEVQQILIFQGQVSGTELRKLMDDARRCSIEVRVLPSYTQLIDGSMTIQPRAVLIDDLLQRAPVHLNTEDIRQWIDHRVILVTGSAGSIGSEIGRQLLEFLPRRIVLVDRSETGQFFLEQELRGRAGRVQVDVCLADVLEERRMRDLLQQYRPDVIFHAAAYKHVPLLESHPGEAVRNIISATRRLADLAVECQTDSFVMISTDKAVNPTSVMGACKRIAERYVQSLDGQSPCRFVTVRFGNVLDSAGSVVQVFRRQIAGGGPVTVTHPNMRRFFMTIPEAARLVIQAGAIGEGGQILLLDMGEPVRIADLAADMIRLSGLRVGEDIAIEYIGPRPGEKLLEELHATGETRLPTSHPKIIVADHQPTNLGDILRAIDRLERLACEAPQEVVAQLREIVEEYRARGAPNPLERRAAA